MANATSSAARSSRRRNPAQGHLQEAGSRLRDPVKNEKCYRRADHHRVARAGQHPGQLGPTRTPTSVTAVTAVGSMSQFHRRPANPAMAWPSSGTAIAYPASDRSTASRRASATGAARRKVHLGHGQRQHVGRIGLPLRAPPLPEHIERVDREIGHTRVHGHTVSHRPPRWSPGRRASPVPQAWRARQSHLQPEGCAPVRSCRELSRRPTGQELILPIRQLPQVIREHDVIEGAGHVGLQIVDRPAGLLQPGRAGRGDLGPPADTELQPQSLQSQLPPPIGADHGGHGAARAVRRLWPSPRSRWPARPRRPTGCCPRAPATAGPVSARIASGGM